MDIRKVIIAYLALQSDLLATISVAYPYQLHSEFLLDMPKGGTVVTLDDSWVYRRHGTGLKFIRERDGRL